MTVNYEKKVMPGAEPFLLPAGEKGCLMIHGISGSPQVFRAMGEYLAEKGITAYGVRLEGHGTRVEDMHSCSYQDWIASARAGIDILREHCKTICCVGLSMGGVIALRLARLHPDLVSGVATICSPYELRALKYRFVPLLKGFVKKIKSGPPSINDPDAVEINYDYHSVPAVHELIKLTGVVRQDLSLIRQPALIFAARQDKVVCGRDASLYYENLASVEKELIWLENSQHVATLDYDKEIIFKRTQEFINKIDG